MTGLKIVGTVAIGLIILSFIGQTIIEDKRMWQDDDFMEMLEFVLLLFAVVALWVS